MNVFRLSKRKYASELSGKGASKYGNRWNSKGTEIIYTAESRALAMAEIVVHATLATLPSDYVMIEINVPDDVSIKEIKFEDFPSDWKNHPPNSASQILGDSFIEEMIHCLFKVPSAVVQGDFNYLINPYHNDFNRITIVEIVDFPFDRRMFK